MERVYNLMGIRSNVSDRSDRSDKSELFLTTLRGVLAERLCERGYVYRVLFTCGIWVLKVEIEKEERVQVANIYVRESEGWCLVFYLYSGDVRLTCDLRDPESDPVEFCVGCLERYVT